jgi:hypothetical protein
MILKYIKQLNLSNSERLRGARKKIALLDNLPDAKYLCEAAKACKEGIATGLVAPLSFALGKFPRPQYEIVKTKEEYGFRKTAKEGQERAESLKLVLGQTNNWPGVTLMLEQYGNPLFLLGPFGAKNQVKNLHALLFPLYGKDNGIICEISSFFNNRREIYEKIGSVLAEEAEKISAALGKEFLEDLIALFSVSKEEEKFLDFLITPVPMEKHLWPEEAKEAGALFIQKSMLYPAGRCGSDWFNPDVASTVWLNDKNQLIIDTVITCGNISWNHENIEEVAQEEAFLAFVNEEVNELLKQTVAMANFGTKIYERVKTKILLGNI